ncbi:MAG: phage major capsid protein [Alphaproteobacteria bacterium]|nr:phage major capsid protein [Alphaproteobacteria bacterium]
MGCSVLNPEHPLRDFTTTKQEDKMHDYDIQTTVDDLARTFEEFKSTNDERLKGLEQKGQEDPYLQEKLKKIETSLDQSEKRLKQMEALPNRPHLETQDQPVSGHRRAFMDYVRKGLDAPLWDYEQKSLSTTSDGDRGYLVPSGLHNRLYQTLQTTSVMRGLANVREISTSSLELLIDKGSLDAGWVAETQDRQETNTPELIKVQIPAHEMYARPRATQKLLDDSMVNVDEWLAQKISQKMAAMENAAFISGEGRISPKGILAYETVRKENWEWGKLEELKTGANGSFAENSGVETLLVLFHSLKTPYLPGASWLMSRTAQVALRNLKDQDSHQYLWQPPLGGMAHPTLLGYPVVVCDDMPSLTSGNPSKSILFGNFKEGYQIVDRMGTRVLRDPYSAKPYVEFYTTRRVGGAVLNFEALKVLNFAA